MQHRQQFIHLGGGGLHGGVQLLLDRRQALQCKAVLLLELLLQHLVVALAHGRIVGDHRLDGFRNGRFQPGQLLLQLVQLFHGRFRLCLHRLCGLPDGLRVLAR